jgi:hypothetical protein
MMAALRPVLRRAMIGAVIAGGVSAGFVIPLGEPLRERRRSKLGGDDQGDERLDGERNDGEPGREAVTAQVAYPMLASRHRLPPRIDCRVRSILPGMRRCKRVPGVPDRGWEGDDDNA